MVQGNYVGTTADGLARLSNFDGVVISGGATGNLIGGGQPLSNGTGVWIQHAFHVLIGGDEDGASNLIAFNTGQGVSVVGASSATIRGNSIHSNGELGIDLAGDGVTLNDDLDADYGANDLQNAPEIRSANVGSTRIAGQLRSTPLSTFIIDFYANTEADPTGFGEGERWLGFIEVTTDEFGVAGFSAESDAFVLGEYVSATATSSDGSTSEFSNARVVSGGRPSRDIGGPPTVASADEPVADATTSSFAALQTDRTAPTSSQSTSNLIGQSTNQTQPVTHPATTTDQDAEGKLIELAINEPQLPYATLDTEPIDSIFAEFEDLLGEALLTT